jgi:hypothetical protein
MTPLIVRCPTTQLPIDTHIENNIDSLAGTWTKVIQVPCPHCKDSHEMRVRDAVFENERVRKDAAGSGVRVA